MPEEKIVLTEEEFGGLREQAQAIEDELRWFEGYAAGCENEDVTVAVRNLGNEARALKNRLQQIIVPF
jgi:hypothetical protein